jgi:flagellar FliL protein
MGKLLPVLIVLFGLIGGTGAGYLLRPAADPDAPADAEVDVAADDHAAPEPADDDHAAAHDAGGHDAPAGPVNDFVKLNNQFVVPVVRDGGVTAIVVLSLSLETESGQAERVYAFEPKLRDAFLQVLFDHANAGGFDGNFTADDSLGALRRSLRESAQAVLGPAVKDILLLDILRQDG